MSILTIPYQASNVIPNYAAGVGQPANTNIVAQFDGFVRAQWDNVASRSGAKLFINGIQMAWVGNEFAGSADWAGFFIKKGWTFRAEGGPSLLIIYPLGA